jgi:DNA-binding transcriptional regulator GbsR (MarR family)
METEFTPAMKAVVAYFEALGPRWGLKPQTCAVHALLYLVGRPLTVGDVANYLGLGTAEAATAIDDLVSWRAVEISVDGLAWTNGEPWDLLFAGMEERRRREIEPALMAIGGAAELASGDGTPRPTVLRINNLRDLLHDLAALGNQVGRLPSSALKRFVRLGGQVSKLFGR